MQPTLSTRSHRYISQEHTCRGAVLPKERHRMQPSANRVDNKDMSTFNDFVLKKNSDILLQLKSMSVQYDSFS